MVADEDVPSVYEADGFKEIEILADRPKYGAEIVELLILAFPDAVIDAIKLAPHILGLLEPTGVFEPEGFGGWS